MMYEELVTLLRKKYDQAPMVMEAADAIEELSKGRPTGKWIRTRMLITGAIEHRCSRCDTPYYMGFAIKMNYCPNCGCQMEVEDDV